MVGMLILASPSPRMTNHPLKGRGQVTRTTYILLGTNRISGTAEARVIKFCTPVSYIKSQYTEANHS